MTFAVKEGESNVVARGKPVFYNVTFGVPYRTVSDIFVQIQSAVPEVQASILPVCVCTSRAGRFSSKRSLFTDGWNGLRKRW